jgi:UDP-glucose 4-epimerase
MDLEDAHVAAINRLLNNTDEHTVEDGDPSRGNFEVFNIGTGEGYSVLEVIASFESATGMKVPHLIGPRRNGDIVAVWADTTKVNEVLGWKARRNLETMMKDAWNWQLACSSQN